MANKIDKTVYVAMIVWASISYAAMLIGAILRDW